MGGWRPVRRTNDFEWRCSGVVAAEPADEVHGTNHRNSSSVRLPRPGLQLRDCNRWAHCPWTDRSRFTVRGVNLVDIGGVPNTSSETAAGRQGRACNSGSASSAPHLQSGRACEQDARWAPGVLGTSSFGQGRQRAPGDRQRRVSTS